MIEFSDGEAVETPVGRWKWATVPLAGLAFGSQVSNAAGELFGNLAFAVGMHMKWKTEAEQAAQVMGPVFRED